VLTQSLLEAAQNEQLEATVYNTSQKAHASLEAPKLTCRIGEVKAMPEAVVLIAPEYPILRTNHEPSYICHLTHSTEFLHYFLVGWIACSV